MTRDLVVVDRLAHLDSTAGAIVATLGIDGAWYWLDGPAPSRWEIRGLAGRPSRSDVAATETVRIELAGRAVTLRLTAAERNQLEIRAGKQCLAAWARDVVGKRKGGPAKVRDLLLAEANG